MALDFNGIKAQSDPNEMQTPICQVVTDSSADPSGGDIKARIAVNRALSSPIPEEDLCI